MENRPDFGAAWEGNLGLKVGDFECGGEVGGMRISEPRFLLEEVRNFSCETDLRQQGEQKW
jgi:hypothetical protein